MLLLFHTFLRTNESHYTFACLGYLLLDVCLPDWTFPFMLANRKPNSPSGDLLFSFFSSTSPINQPPTSAPAMRNGWYLWGELAFPFLASIFISTTSESKRGERLRSSHSSAWSSPNVQYNVSGQVVNWRRYEVTAFIYVCHNLSIIPTLSSMV